MITAVDGVRVGHWTDDRARTGCTVVLLPAGTTASGEVRGAAPGTREWALLEPGRTVDAINAVVLTGGSAFGLAACDGVTRWCEERGIGFPTPAGPVPIVIGLVLYDLGVGDPSVRPGPGEGYGACEAARAGPEAVGSGPVGAGTGATIGKWRGAPGAGPAGPEAGTGPQPGTGPKPGAGPEAGTGPQRGAGPQPGGLGSATTRRGDLVVAALLAVNAVGEPRPVGRALTEPRVPVLPIGPTSAGPAGTLQATTIGVIVTNASLDKVGCLRMAQSGHDGLARALDPVHTGADGDALVAAATGEIEAPLETVRVLAAWVVEQAVADAVHHSG